MKKLDDHSIFKMIILGLMLSICTLTTYYFHFILKSEVIFTHLFYIPIILASLWWSRKGAVVGLFLALMLVISNLMNPDMPYIWSNVVRGIMFVFVGRLVDALHLRNLILIDSLNRSQEYQNKLINHSNASIIVWDPDIKITRVNKAFEHITGYTADEVNGKEICILFSKATQKESLKKIEGTLNSEYMEAVEIPFTCKDGATRLMLCNLANVYEEDGTTVLSTIAQCIDITERRRAVEALRKEKEFSENLVQTSPTFFVAINSEGKTIMMNNAMLQALGYTLEEVVDKDYLATVVPESNRPMLSKVFDEIISLRKPTLNENLVLTKDGREILVEWHGRPVFIVKNIIFLTYFLCTGNFQSIFLQSSALK
ncbi:MAG: PAS domain-containing protein, partial [Candidatus Cloacimonetes bacterium]|nr:PAS domain-containing protein [Candidatus Cloacimonadota bacterium]